MSPRAPGQATILVIDESEAVLASTRATLEGAGFHVVSQTRAAGAVAVILQEKPELVLIDLTTPSPGAEIIGKLFGREQPGSGTIILLHSALNDEVARARAIAGGAHGHVPKTEDSLELLRQIHHWLKLGPRTSHSKLRAASAPDLPRVDENAATRPSGTTRLDLPVVLFIDDDMGTLSGFGREVQSEPYSVEFALSGPRAIERILSAAPPDLVVCDLLMPEPSGREVYRRALAVDGSWQDRFIFVTGAALVAEITGFLDEFTGIVLYKPVLGQNLRSAIRRALGNRVAARATTAVRNGNPS